MITRRFQDALSYAAGLHAAQRRKASEIPYVAHLLAVTALVLEHGATEDEAIAALLHDAVEDQGGLPRLAEIRERYGDEVAAIVQGCTDTAMVPKPPWRERKEAFIANLAGAPPAVCRIVAADKLHNVRSLVADFRRFGEDLWRRFRGGREGTLWYYRTLADRLCGRAPAGLVEELEQVVTQLESLVEREGRS
jgi:(p)ppGpp synthase/HD superfamily hydrolase